MTGYHKSCCWGLSPSITCVWIHIHIHHDVDDVTSSTSSHVDDGATSQLKRALPHNFAAACANSVQEAGFKSKACPSCLLPFLAAFAYAVWAFCYELRNNSTINFVHNLDYCWAAEHKVSCFLDASSSSLMTYPQCSDRCAQALPT